MQALLKSISESTAIAEKDRAKVKVIVDAVSQKAAEIAAVKEDAEQVRKEEAGLGGLGSFPGGWCCQAATTLRPG